MCGITGIATPAPGTPIDRAALEAMTDLLAHRGPDGRGFHSEPGIGLGMRRLSIVDLETGEQPISNEDGSVLVVCNGEIYNAPELRQGLLNRGHRFRSHSDVEVVVHLYEEWESSACSVSAGCSHWRCGTLVSGRSSWRGTGSG